MALVTKSTRQPLATYKDLPDMSTGGELGHLVTVAVGHERRTFGVHLGKLGPLAKLVEDDASDVTVSWASITLPNEIPETFNALVNWVYGSPLPRASKAINYYDENGNLITSTDVAQKMPYLAWFDDYIPEGEAKDSAARDWKLSDALATQCMLLDLMMFADRYEWEDLYNAAIDAFRAGEINMMRNQPSTLHIAVVYSRTGADSPVREFLCDYAYALAKKNRDIMWYWRKNWFQTVPEFLADMLKRVDGKGPFQYPFENYRILDDDDGDKTIDMRTLYEEAPLDLDETTYHVHGGCLWLDCRRSSQGLCAAEMDDA
ncbi:hypothetical protein F5B22DRAFT_653832 [Xylaria bambusicola]|uniref:uncharacterized protein n=1 Tax=Xylaria bambusicola TaxID=326684 RepID=UPI002008067E|nr:uncharacterized protein F5B22DRAFT_653832 [Xylaria bambusicola]KAI0520883.1 hypothetical protein F5B22DRAFT_653832 [Xylaria bambusicola]